MDYAGMRGLDVIRKNSEELRRLDDRVTTTARVRDRSAEHRAEWERACKEFHQGYDALAFPGGSETLRKVRDHDPAALAAAIRFLAADPYHRESGYTKEMLWRQVQRCALPDSALAMLESAALHYLERRIRREFWIMCKAMARLGRSRFWYEVSIRARVPGTPEAFRAHCLLTHGADIHAGAQLRRRIQRDWMASKYGRD